MILYCGDRVPELIPGQIVFMICGDGKEHKGEMILRRSGLEIRDCIRWFYIDGTTRHKSVVVARKPIEGTVAENVLKYGCGGLNIDVCRIPTGDSLGGGNGQLREVFNR
jgi:site-specific DNA-methyltransferase (adenine-specific)